VLIDEAHHAEAPSYRLVREHFNRARYVYFTGTPHRSDQKPLRAELIYSCTMRDALLRDEPYIKRLCYLPVPVTSMTITHAATEQRFQLDSFEDIVAFASRTDCSRWMAKALSSSLSSHSHVIRLIVAKLQALRAVSGVHHQAILQAADTTEAEFLVALWRALPGGNACPHIASIHSELSTKDRDRVMQDLRANRLDAIVHVGMLGEGFDHQTLSVCGIFRRFSSMAPFVQLVGRILRRIQGAGANDNVGYVIAHPGLGLAPLWRAYKKESPTILPPSDDDDADDGNADLCEKKSAHVTVLPATMKNFENMDLQETVSDIPYEDWFL
jgi:DNA repair protein RadD